MINYKLRLFTPRSSYGAKEMAPKSQLCACSFQDSLRQKNWALEQIRKFPDTIGYVWTAENDSNTLRVDAKIFASAKKYLRKKKFPDTCGHGHRITIFLKYIIGVIKMWSLENFLPLALLPSCERSFCLIHFFKKRILLYTFCLLVNAAAPYFWAVKWQKINYPSVPWLMCHVIWFE